ncbi:hypothetical protein TIFTF001_021306 [Ficus carica]|uniref:Uncharacterized protein n=1 Tax=Ficus carica TaxID=3494 RepID=A0AA88ACG4_FICCA|nr:hypothetical protein TIFTF001_021306 [Ficus carica]
MWNNHLAARHNSKEINQLDLRFGRETPNYDPPTPSTSRSLNRQSPSPATIAQGRLLVEPGWTSEDMANMMAGGMTAYRPPKPPSGKNLEGWTTVKTNRHPPSLSKKPRGLVGQVVQVASDAPL